MWPSPYACAHFILCVVSLGAKRLIQPNFRLLVVRNFGERKMSARNRFTHARLGEYAFHVASQSNLTFPLLHFERLIAKRCTHPIKINWNQDGGPGTSKWTAEIWSRVSKHDDNDMKNSLRYIRLYLLKYFVTITSLWYAKETNNFMIWSYK